MANRFFSPDQQFADETGAPYAGGFLYFYASGTDTPLNTYSNRALSVANTNPIELDSAGRAGSVFLQNLAYKVVLKDVNAVQIWSEDPVYSSDYSTVAQVQTNAGSPNGTVAGTAGSGLIPSSVVWDSTNSILYVCTTTGSVSTAVWTAVNASTAAAVVLPPQGRLTLTSGVPFTTNDVTGATAIYFTPYPGSLVPIYSGSTFVPITFTELTLTLVSAHTLSSNFDVFVFNNSGVATLVTGPAWTSRTARGTGAGTTELTTLSGLAVNNVQISGRNGAATYTIAANRATFLGTFGTTGSAGQTEDSTLNRLLWNNWNRRPRALSKVDATNHWNQTVASTWRQARASTANQITYVVGLLEDIVEIVVSNSFFNSTGSEVINAEVGVGIDTTTTSNAIVTSVTNSTGLVSATIANYTGYPGLGYHYLAWVEYMAPLTGTPTCTWIGMGSNGIADGGIAATIWA